MQELLNAIKEGNAEKVKDLLAVQADLANQIIPQQGISPLMLAIYYRKAEVISAIRQFRQEINIFEASSLGEMDFVKQYFENQIDKLNVYSPDGFTCLGFACFFGHLEVAKFLIEKGTDVNLPSNNAFQVAPIHSACAISNYEIAYLLLRNGANPNAKQQNGVTPLHSAAHHGQTQLAKLLINYGADIYAKMDKGQTPLMMAEEQNFEEMVKLLREIMLQK